MRVARVFSDQPLASGATLILDSDTSHYLLRVMRLHRGDRLILFNGNGKEYQAVLMNADRKQATVLIGDAGNPQTESVLCVSLGQGIPRGERMDFVLQKSVELGAASITPLVTNRSQVHLSGKRLENRLAHWQGILRSACEQSNRIVLPALNGVTRLPDWLESRQAQERQHKLVLDPTALCRLKELEPATSVSIVIGPEGGLDQNEIKLAVSHGFQRIRLGPRILRTETAALATLAALQTLWGDL